MTSFLIIALGMLMGAQMVQPETPRLIEESDLIVYAEILKATPEIEEHARTPLPPGSYRTFPAQKAQARVLRILKKEIPAELGDEEVVKEEAAVEVDKA